MVKAKKSASKDPRESKAGSSNASSKVKDSVTLASATEQVHVHDTALSASKETKEVRRRLASADEMVTVRIPRAFNLQVLDDRGSRLIRYEAGTDEMPRSHAEHDYSIANGVEIVND